MDGNDPHLDEPWWVFSRADCLFVVFAIIAFGVSHVGMLDDPGLGWHLRIADAMFEKGGFLRHEQFCYPTEGRPCVTQAWLGDLAFRAAYAWAGLNGIAALTALVIALTLRCLFTRMLRERVPPMTAAFWTTMAAAGTLMGWSARPNIFTMLGVALVAMICEQSYRVRITRKQSLLLIPIFVCWPNLHGGFLAGIIILGITVVVAWGTPPFIADADRRSQAIRTAAWLTLLAMASILATFANPYGFGLHLWNYRLVSDPFIQTATTIEWKPPPFGSKGMLLFEIPLLLLPVIAAFNRKRPDVLSLALCVAWLHFGLTARRYMPLFVVVAAPAMAAMTLGIPQWRWATQRLSARMSSRLRTAFTAVAAEPPFAWSIGFALLFLAFSPFFGGVARHTLMPARALDEFLSLYRGERIFHGLNWGGYLTWHGWNLKPRLKTWIDDRLDVHGAQQFREYRELMLALPGWEDRLSRYRVELLCLPSREPLTKAARVSPLWRELKTADGVSIFRRIRWPDGKPVGTAIPQDGASESPGSADMRQTKDTPANESHHVTLFGFRQMPLRKSPASTPAATRATPTSNSTQTTLVLSRTRLRTRRRHGEMTKERS